MKEFFKFALAGAVGTLIAGAFMLFMSFVMLMTMVMAGASSAAPVLTDGTVLRISLSGTLEEQAAEDPFAALFGENELMQTQGLADIKKAIEVAKTNDLIAGIYLEGGILSADFAQLQELRTALLDFKKSGKFVYAYAEQYSTGGYFLASAADKVALNPQGMLDWHGLGSQVIFFTKLMEKVGVKAQVFKVGTFKSAVEPYINTEMSAANREQVQSFIGDMWQHVRSAVGTSRKLHPDTLNAYADRYITFADARDYQKMKLVDTLTYADGVRENLRALSGQSKVTFISPVELAKLDNAAESDKKVAVYYAEGSIVDVATGNPFTGGTQKEIVGSKVVADLDKLANDESVKAVVLRINSGGGSAYASEQMWRAIQLLKAKKPVVVSMSGMAASGGYYMACGANTIFAENTTLTGSIGIFGMIPDVSGLMTDKLGLTFDVVKTNAPADFGTPARPLNESESAAMQAYVERGYKLFLKRVADGRRMKTEAVDAVAQGRVWTGAQALKRGLVDRIGGLDQAVAEAAKLAKLGNDYSVINAVTPKPWFESMLDNAKDDYLESKLRAKFGSLYEPMLFIGSLEHQNHLQARIPFFLNIK